MFNSRNAIIDRDRPFRRPLTGARRQAAREQRERERPSHGV